MQHWIQLKLLELYRGLHHISNGSPQKVFSLEMLSDELRQNIFVALSDDCQRYVAFILHLLPQDVVKHCHKVNNMIVIAFQP